MAEDEREHHDHEQGDTDLGGVAGYLPPARARDVAEQDHHAAPDRAAGHVEGQENPVTHARHASQTRDHDPQSGGEPAEEHCPAATSGQVAFRPLDALGFQEAAQGPDLEHAPAVLAADQVADGIADDCPGDPCDEHRPQAHPAIGRKHPAEYQRGLPGKDETQEQRRLKGGDRENDQQRHPSAEVKDVLDQPGHRAPKDTSAMPLARQWPGQSWQPGEAQRESLRTVAAPAHLHGLTGRSAKPYDPHAGARLRSGWRERQPVATRAVGPSWGCRPASLAYQTWPAAAGMRARGLAPFSWRGGDAGAPAAAGAGGMPPRNPEE